MNAIDHKRLFGYTYITENTYGSARDASIFHDMVADHPRFDRELDWGSIRCGCSAASKCVESDCPNRVNNFECDIGNCTKRCKNSQFQRWDRDNVIPPVTVKVNPGVGLALFSTKAIVANEFVGEIKGMYETFPKDKVFMDSLYVYEFDYKPRNLVSVSDRKKTLNLWKQSNEFKFMEHDCDANCNIYQWYVGCQVRLAVISNRPIDEDTPITVNYGTDYFKGGLKCHCGTCRLQGS